VELPVPLSFAFRWCTDYTAADRKYAGEDVSINLRRKVVSKSKRHVVFENLYDVGGGWGWERHTVTLVPPDRWHSHGIGNYHESVLDYALTAIDNHRTRLDMRWKTRRRGPSRGPRASGSRVEAYVAGLWRKRARHLERAYRQRRRA